MRIFDRRSTDPKVVAQHVSYDALNNRRVAKSIHENPAVMAMYRRFVAKPTAQPVQGDIFRLDHGKRTPFGWVAAHVPGVIAHSHDNEHYDDEALTYHVALPMSRTLLGRVVGHAPLREVVVTVPKAEIVNTQYLSDKTLAIGHAVAEVANGNVILSEEATN